MEKNYTEKEEFKTIQSNQTELNLGPNPYKTQTYLFKNKIDYSKKINTKNMATITKFFSKDKMLLETSLYRHDYNISNKIQKKNKKFDTVEKEKILNQIILSKKDLDKINNDLKEYKKFYHQLQETNLTFKVIIERLLKINQLDNSLDNIEYTISENKKLEKKLSPFKKQLINYEKSIERQERILTETKKEKKINNFYEINNLLDEKNQELENLISQNKKLQMSKHAKYEQINYYYNTIQDLRDNYTKMDGHLKINEKKLNNCDDEIYNLETEKEQIIKKLNVIIEESVNIDLSNEHKKKELNSIKKKYERQKNIEKNKEKDENELINILNKIENMKKIIEKNNNKINMINYDNDEMENDIYIMQAENDKLIDKYKQAQKEINTLNKYEKEIKLIKEQITKIKEKKNEIKIDNSANNDDTFFVTLQKDVPKEEKIDENSIIIEDVEKLKNELEEKQKEKALKEKELEEIKNEYNSLNLNKQEINQDINL
jgi:chromosome segregation ATPase